MPGPPPIPPARGDAYGLAQRALTTAESALGIAQKALDVAHRAAEQSNIAANHAVATHTVVSQMSARLDTFEGRVTGAIVRLEKSMSSRASKHDLRALEDDVEDSKTHNLLELVKAQRGEARRWRNVVIALGVGGGVEVIRVVLEHVIR